MSFLNKVLLYLSYFLVRILNKEDAFKKNFIKLSTDNFMSILEEQKELFLYSNDPSFLVSLYCLSVTKDMPTKELREEMFLTLNASLKRKAEWFLRK